MNSLVQLELKKRKQTLKPGQHWKKLEELVSLVDGSGLTPMAGRRLPSAADAGHVGVKLTGEAAACSAFQEGGPDGWLK